MNKRLSTLAVACGLITSVCFAQNPRQVAIAPFHFQNGDRTSRSMVRETVRAILEHHGFSVIPAEVSDPAYNQMNPQMSWRGGQPFADDLGRYAGPIHADLVVTGKVSWNTRSIWVGTGPKTISTATVDLFIFNTHTKKLVLDRTGIEGRSDEKESALKDVGDVLLTPLITVVSGGPATPREQRAEQIAIARAIRPWAIRHETRR